MMEVAGKVICIPLVLSQLWAVEPQIQALQESRESEMKEAAASSIETAVILHFQAGALKGSCSVKTGASRLGDNLRAHPLVLQAMPTLDLMARRY